MLQLNRCLESREMSALKFCLRSPESSHLVQCVASSQISLGRAPLRVSNLDDATGAYLVALVRAGVRFEKGKLVERPDESTGDQQVA
jgi:hypothetical protein